MEFMSAGQVRAAGPEIGRALHDLLESRSLARKTNARQWRFLSACFEAVARGTRVPEFEDLPPPHAAQLKFEVSDKLKRYYARRQSPPRYVFQLVHQRELATLGLPDPDDYPAVGGYAVLVRDGSTDLPPPRSRSERSDLRLYLERVVGAAVDAEFSAYLALPKIDLEVLRPWFDPEGPAYAEIADRVRQRARLGSIISNPLNPSTKRLCSVQVRRIQAREATVGTVEYWYLRWWDKRQQEYVYASRETNRQTYVIREQDGEWRVWQNLRPAPRVVLQNRRVRGTDGGRPPEPEASS